MDVIHFTHGAADPLDSSDATGAPFLPLAKGEGNSHISCLHLETGAKVTSPSVTHAAALLVEHGRITVTTLHPLMRIGIHAGTGCVIDCEEPYSIESTDGAIVIILEADELSAHEPGISTPERIAVATWPSDAV